MKNTGAIDPLIMQHILSEESRSALILSEADTEPYFSKPPLNKLGKGKDSQHSQLSQLTKKTLQSQRVLLNVKSNATSKDQSVKTKTTTNFNKQIIS
jgi:hypothetical protein